MYFSPRKLLSVGTRMGMPFDVLTWWTSIFAKSSKAFQRNMYIYIYIYIYISYAHVQINDMQVCFWFGRGSSINGSSGLIVCKSGRLQGVSLWGPGLRLNRVFGLGSFGLCCG